jgi:GT2 family glycosyltransferase
MPPDDLPGTPSREPFVSVVIPAYNRADFISHCLASLCTQTYPQDRYEILLVDDGSTDDTASQARIATEGWPGRVRIIQKTNGGPASARNVGIRASKAEIIAFLDSDCVAEPDWLMSLVTVLVASGAAGVGGPLVNVAPKGWVARYLTAAALYRHRARHGKVEYLLTANVAFRRTALLGVNGFSEASGAWGEDADLSFRLIQSGYTLVLAERGIVTHYGTPHSLGGFIKELARYGYGNYVHSANWRNGRTPSREVIRHSGAVVLSPVLALTYAGRVGFWSALTFWPLIVIEHTAFIAGLLKGMIRGGKAEASDDSATKYPEEIV